MPILRRLHTDTERAEDPEAIRAVMRARKTDPSPPPVHGEASGGGDVPPARRAPFGEQSEALDFLEEVDRWFAARPGIEAVGEAFVKAPSVEGARAILDALDGVPGVDLQAVENAAAFVAAAGESFLTAVMQKQADARASAGDIE